MIPDEEPSRLLAMREGDALPKDYFYVTQDVAPIGPSSHPARRLSDYLDVSPVKPALVQHDDALLDTPKTKARTRRNLVKKPNRKA